ATPRPPRTRPVCGENNGNRVTSFRLARCAISRVVAALNPCRAEHLRRGLHNAHFRHALGERSWFDHGVIWVTALQRCGGAAASRCSMRGESVNLSFGSIPSAEQEFLL